MGTPQPRIDALDIVTGRKQFAMDLDVPGALPTMLCRAPTINGTATSVQNMAQVLAMPGITDVAIIPHSQFVPVGVAVRGETFGQCIDAVDALKVVWGAGSVDGKSDADGLADLKKNTPPDVEVIVMPPTGGQPGGAGEFGVAASMAAVACAYGRATGTMPTSFPINHNGPLGFTPYPTVPPLPESPTDGLQNTY